MSTTRERPWIVTWYRARNIHGPIIRLWATGATLLVIGSLLMGIALTELLRAGSLWRIVCGVLGFAAVISGPTITAVGVTRRMLRDDDALLILRSDGLIYRLALDEWRIAWAALDTVAMLDDDAGLALYTDDGGRVEIRERFDASFAELAREIESTQRKALMGLLRTPRPAT